MGFVGYLFLGTVSYGLGWAIRVYVLNKNKKQAQPYSLKHPIILQYLGAFFMVMLGISYLIGRFLLNHQDIDILFMIVNSVVATFVFSFGINPEQSNYDVPD